VLVLAAASVPLSILAHELTPGCVILIVTSVAFAAVGAILLRHRRGTRSAGCCSDSPRCSCSAPTSSSCS
jgi:hypothetical protein